MAYAIGWVVTALKAKEKLARQAQIHEGKFKPLPWCHSRSLNRELLISPWHPDVFPCYSYFYVHPHSENDPLLLYSRRCFLFWWSFASVWEFVTKACVMYDGLTYASSMKICINGMWDYWTNCTKNCCNYCLFTSFGWNSSLYHVRTRTQMFAGYFQNSFTVFLDFSSWYICRNKSSSRIVWLVFMRWLNLYLFDVGKTSLLVMFPL